MKKILAFTLAILLVLPGFMIWGATDEGYGEDETALGQFVDTFENLSNVSVRVLVELNATIEAMELNFTGIPIYEDFTTYDETDPSNRITVNSATLFTWTQLDRNDGITHLQKDYGVGNFAQNFIYSWILEITQLNAGDADNRDYGYNLCFTNNAGNPLVDPRITILITQNGADDTKYKVEVRIDDPHGGFDIDASLLLDVGTKYYTTITRLNGDDITLVFRTGSFSGGISDTLTVNLLNFNDNFRYILPIYAKSSATDSNDWMSGTSEFLWNQSGFAGYVLAGYFTTVDYLSDPLANGSALVAMVNTSIPANTDIQLQFSNDNATWGDNAGIPGDSMDLQGGFESIDLRDLNYSTGYYSRFNLSTADNSATPRVYQNRLITMIGQGAGPGGNVTINQLNGSWIDYNLTEIGVIRGTLDSGNLASTYFIDGDMFNVSEVAMTPGMGISANVTGIDDNAISLWITIFALYDGNLVHDFDIEVWNFTASAWVEDSHIEDMIVFEWVNSTIYGLRIPNEFLNAGEVRIRLDHESPGNPGHDLFIDYFRVQAFVPTGLAVAGVGAGANWGLLWFLLILICVPIALVLLKESRR